MYNFSGTTGIKFVEVPTQLEVSITSQVFDPMPIVLPVQRLQLLMVNCTFSFHEWVSAMTKVHGKTFGEPSKQVAFFVAWHASLLPKIDTTMTWWKKEFLVSLYKVMQQFQVQPNSIWDLIINMRGYCLQSQACLDVKSCP